VTVKNFPGADGCELAENITYLGKPLELLFGPMPFHRFI